MITKQELKQQIDKLAKFIMAEVEGEPSRSEGVVDCAIRIMTDQQERLLKCNEIIRGRDW